MSCHVMTHEERQLLDEAMIQTYNQKGITHNNESLPDPEAPGSEDRHVRVLVDTGIEDVHDDQRIVVLVHP
mgnify:CR=1 FL=1